MRNSLISIAGSGMFMGVSTNSPEGISNSPLTPARVFALFVLSGLWSSGELVREPLKMCRAPVPCRSNLRRLAFPLRVPFSEGPFLKIEVSVGVSRWSHSKGLFSYLRAFHWDLHFETQECYHACAGLGSQTRSWLMNMTLLDIGIKAKMFQPKVHAESAIIVQMQSNHRKRCKQTTATE